MDVENVVMKNVSYLHARDPSILAWNRHGLDNVRVNLAKELLGASNGSSQEEASPDHIQVFLRIKDGMPFDHLYEIEGNNLVCNVPEGSQALRNIKEGESMTKTFSFTKIFGSRTKQIEIFNSVVKPKILGFINGKNSTLMTYGASGSGKTFTIVGTPEEPGIIPRALEYIFRTIPKLKEAPNIVPLPNGEIKCLDEHNSILENSQKSLILNATYADRTGHIKTYKQMQQRLSSEAVARVNDLSRISVSIWVSFAEIYNENIYDLLTLPPSRGQQRPRLRLGNSKGSCYIKNLTSINVTSGLEAYQILQYGLHHLNYAATSINSHSSRSHSIFTMKLIQMSEADDGVYVSTFNFCDLAGSERVKKTLNVGKRLKESNNINTSLLVLGRCINSIKTTQQLKDNRLVPFRESKLTQLFQRALTGLEDITMIVNMNPTRDMFDETQHVLNFSAIAKEIVIEEQPKITKPKRMNRFSQYMERKTFSIPSIKEADTEDEKDLEISKLKNIISDLYMEIEQKKMEHQQEMTQEREYIRSEYKRVIDDMMKRYEEQKTRAVSKVKKEYEEKIQMLNNHYSKIISDQSDIISIDSSSDEDDSQSEKKSLKDEIKDLERQLMEQNNKYKLLERELCDTRLQKERMHEELSVVKETLRRLRIEEYEMHATLQEAEKAYSDMQSDLREAEAKNKKLTSEKIQLEERVEQLEELISHFNSDLDEAETDNVFCDGNDHSDTEREGKEMDSGVCNGNEHSESEKESKETDSGVCNVNDHGDLEKEIKVTDNTVCNGNYLAEVSHS